MNRTALQDYFSVTNFCEIIVDTRSDIEDRGVEDIMNDKLFFAGILHRLETLGEKAKNLSEDFKIQFPNIPWNDIARTRDLITHHYHKIDPEIVRGILNEQISILNVAVPYLQKVAFVGLDPDDQMDVEK